MIGIVIKMIGQQNLLNKIDSYDIVNFPHSILLVGERGSEQDEVCSYISNKFGFTSVDITEMLNKDIIDYIGQVKVMTLYIVKISELDEKNQNVLLKLFEEPSEYAYIILLCENDNLVLETIKTRSYRLNIDKYTKDMLEPLIENEDKDLVLSICHTPGQIEVANHTDIKSLFDLCSNLPELLKYMSLYDVLKYSDKINFSDEYDKYDLFLFIRALRKVLINYSNLYKCIIDLDMYVWTMVDRMDGKRRFFDHFMINLWRTSLNLN